MNIKMRVFWYGFVHAMKEINGTPTALTAIKWARRTPAMYIIGMTIKTILMAVPRSGCINIREKNAQRIISDGMTV